MRLQNLTLNNFKGVDGFILPMNGDPATSVFGDNATGKTTLFDAWSWLFTDKDSLGQPAIGKSGTFEIKKLDANGDPEHNLEHSVEATIHNHKKGSFTLKKVFIEVWSRNRGARKKEFTGHTVDYFIDGVKTGTKKEYVDFVSEICTEELFRVLSNTRYFAETMNWVDRRKMLLEVSGDISDADVIDSNTDLADLPGILGKLTTAQYKKVVKSKLPEINKELGKIPTRIDEVLEGRTAEEPLAADIIEKTLAELGTRQQETLRAISDLKAGGDSGELEREIRKLKADIKEIEDARKAEKKKHADAQEDIRIGLERAWKKAKADTSDSKVVVDRLVRQEQETEASVKRIEGEIQALRNEWHEHDSKGFEGDTVCPTCGQTLPDDQIDAAREKFNASKAAKLKEITSNGTTKGEYLKTVQAKLAETSSLLTAENKKHADLINKEADAKAALDAFKPAEMTPSFGTMATDDLNKKIADLQARIDAEEKPDTSELESKLSAIEADIKTFTQTKSERQNWDRSKGRIAELEKEQERLAAEYEKFEGHLFLIEEFDRTKARLLNDTINSRFSYVSFRLFKDHINGGLEECCDVMVNGVPWSSVNNAGRINAGLDICNVLAAHYGVFVPIFIDNAESVTNIMPTKAQQIQLVVIKCFDELTVNPTIDQVLEAMKKKYGHINIKELQHFMSADEELRVA